MSDHNISFYTTFVYSPLVPLKATFKFKKCWHLHLSYSFEPCPPLTTTSNLVLLTIHTSQPNSWYFRFVFLQLFLSSTPTLSRNNMVMKDLREKGQPPRYRNKIISRDIELNTHPLSVVPYTCSYLQHWNSSISSSLPILETLSSILHPSSLYIH